MKVVKRTLITFGIVGVTLIGGVSPAAANQRHAIAYEFGCVDWSQGGGCATYSACTVWSDLSWDCNYYSR